MKRLLLPFGWIYHLITRLRNHLYDTGYRKSFRFDGVFTISVGNLNMGGSGKTPVTEYLIEMLKDRYRVAALSRGYGRLTYGLRVLSDTDVAASAGDEPVQLYRKFRGQIQVVVSEDRSLAIPTLMNQEQQVEVIIMDDAFQHRRVVPDLNILLTRWSDPFYKDRMFPAGWLRESSTGAKRADMVVFTKCPDNLPDSELNSARENALRLSGDVPVFFTGYHYGQPTAFGLKRTINQKIILLTGIAHSDFLLNEVRKTFEVIKHFRFSDHHHYSHQEILEISNLATNTGADVLTTEKDMVRLLSFSNTGLFLNQGWFYLPISIRFLKSGTEFDNIILAKVESKNAELEN
ncbi:MAG: tetraacyldisaccharide 4'-kinase [Bacteroidetes bacterium]|nr:tetraacyldisaccharide 4'-kinase [Bacteroidota bacterium]